MLKKAKAAGAIKALETYGVKPPPTWSHDREAPVTLLRSTFGKDEPALANPDKKDRKNTRP